jgi:transcriptional regulator with XRE-family HTH domain
MSTESFARRLERLRKERGFTRATMAELVGMKESTYRDTEAGAIPRNFMVLILRIAKALGCPLGFLLTGEYSNDTRSISESASKIKTLAEQIMKDLRD